MARLSNFSKEEYAALFNAKLQDTSACTADATGLKINESLRTVLIGVGGTGVKTIDTIKGTLKKKFAPGWEKYVAFLAVDTSWTEIEGTSYLKSSEGVVTTLPGADARLSNVNTYAPAVKPFMIDGTDAGTAPFIGSLSQDGANRTRLIGKVKIHDKDIMGTAIGCDEAIVNKLTQIIMNLEPILPGSNQKYSVFVIGSGSGGTGSGSFVEIPSLVKQAFGANPYELVSFLYLPDTLVAVDPTHAGELMANGYATLKEMDYFQGMDMRRGYAEKFTYNNAAQPEIVMDDNVFFDVPYLVGSPAAAGADAAQVAQNVIAEFLASLVVDATPIPGVHPFVTSAMMANATSPVARNSGKYLSAPGISLPGVDHAAYNGYAAIGFAQATAPVKTIRSYAVSSVIKNAGIKPVDPVERATLAATAAPDTILPFRSELDQFSATAGTAKAKELIGNIIGRNSIHGAILNGKSYDIYRSHNVQAAQVTFDEVRKGTWNGIHTTQIPQAATNAANTTAMDALTKAINERFAEYKSAVAEFVKKEGPIAFVSVFEGRFKAENGDAGHGIREMLEYLAGKKNEAGVLVLSPNAVSEAQSKIANAKNVIDHAPLINLHRPQQLQAWVEAVNKYGAACINEKRAQQAYGPNGLFYTHFVAPALILTEQIKCFGNILDVMADVYSGNGAKMSDYAQFSNAVDGETEVNIGAISNSAYNWLLDQAKASVEATNAKAFRNGLVDAFFADPEAWLEVPQRSITNDATGKIKLVNPDNPVPARKLFDDYATENVTLQVDVSMLDLFTKMSVAGTGYNATAKNILTKLMAQSQVRLNGNIGNVHSYIQYPNSLNTAGGEGAAIAQAIQDEAANLGVANVYPSDDTDAILFYQQATCLELSRLANLPAWEQQYLAVRNAPAGKLIHGKSPDTERVVENGQVKYVEGQKWYDYPALVQQDDPMTPDPATGHISHEGEMLLKLKQEVEKAKKLGVLYSEQQAPKQWIVKRVFFDRATAWKEPEITSLEQDAKTGLFPQGKALAEQIAKLNGRDFTGLVKRVTIEYGGIYSEPAETEKAAWGNAVRVLRKHHPMMRELRRSMELMEAWSEKIAEINTELLNSRRPGMMMWLLKAGLLTKQDSGAWVYVQPNKQTTMVANYTDAMMKFMKPAEKRNIENGLLGYELYKKLDKLLPGEQLVEAMQRAQADYQILIENQAMDKLNAADAFFTLIDGERTALEAKGAGNGETVPYAFSSAMVDFKFSDEQLKEIQKVYSRMADWELF